MNDVVFVKGGVAVRHHRTPITGQRIRLNAGKAFLPLI